MALSTSSLAHAATVPSSARATLTTRATLGAAASFSLVWSTGPLHDQGGPIAESSPMVATLDGDGPSVVVGDRSGYLYAFHLSNGTPVAGWPVYDGGAPIDSTPSVAALGATNLDTVFVGTGDAAEPATGGFEAFGPQGQLLWHTTVQNPPTDLRPAGGVQASLTIGDLQDGTDVFAGSLGQEAYGLSAATGAPLSGWPIFSADSIFSTAAVGDLYGSGQNELVVGGASTQGVAYGLHYQSGGHVRVLNAEGQLLYDYNTDQEVDSSPAIGPFLPAGANGIVIGTGSYYPGTTDTAKLLAFTTRLVPVWSATLDGCTASSPALVDIAGQLDVVEGTDLGPADCGNRDAGSVWVLDGETGAPLCHASVPARVIGSVVAFDPSLGGQPELLVPTIHGVEVLSSTCQKITVLAPDLGFQNAALVTDDPNGTIGITIAGYNGDNQGVIDHYEILGSNGAAIGPPSAPAPGTWPMFHHDPSLSGLSAPLAYLGTQTPSNLVAQPGDGQVTLTWTPPTSAGAGPVTGYDVYVGTAPGQESSTPVNPVPLTATTDTLTGLSNGTTYYFEVTALDAAGQGAPVQASATPAPLSPPPPLPPSSVPSPPGVPAGLFGPPQAAVVRRAGTTALRASSGAATATLEVPAAALPANTTITLAPSASPAAVTSYLPATNAYLTAFSVAWATPQATSPPASAPVWMTLSDGAIVPGDGVYEMTPSGLRLVASATTRGVVRIPLQGGGAFVVAELARLRLLAPLATPTRRSLAYDLACVSGLRCTGSVRVEVTRKGPSGYRHPTVAIKWGFSIWGHRVGPVHLRLTRFGKVLLAHASGPAPLRMTLVAYPKGGPRTVLPVYLKPAGASTSGQPRSTSAPASGSGRRAKALAA
jgi:hypothetical protein